MPFKSGDFYRVSNEDGLDGTMQHGCWATPGFGAPVAPAESSRCSRRTVRGSWATSALEAQKPTR
eukprot:11199065-Lingulodinium_polyedra.AAC.1